MQCGASNNVPQSEDSHLVQFQGGSGVSGGHALSVPMKGDGAGPCIPLHPTVPGEECPHDT